MVLHFILEQAVQFLKKVKHAMRLSFSYTSIEQIEIGIVKLSEAINDFKS